MKNEKPTYEDLENKIFQLQKEIFELKSKQNNPVEKLDLEPNILDKILDISPIGVSYVDASGKVVYSNKRAEEIFQLPKMKLLEIEATSAVWQATTLDGKPFPDEELPFAQVKNTKKPISNIVHAIEYEGQKKVISVSATPFLNNTNDFMGMVAVVEDITDHKLAEEKLKESEDHLSLFFAQSLDGFLFMMLDEPIEWNDSVDKQKTLDYVFGHQRVTKVNSALLEQYGATEEQYIGLTPNDLFKHDIKHGQQVWKDFFDKGQLHIDTHEMKFDGTDMIIEGDYICLFDSHKRITGHFGIQKDVTALRHAEEVLQKSKNELQEYWDSNISAAFISSIDGEILNCNPTFLKLFGLEEKLPSDRMDSIKLYKNIADRSELIRKVSENGKVENYEIDFKKHDGKVINSIINAIGIFDDAGKLIRMRGYIVDITDRKNAEEKLRESERKFKDMANLLPQIIFETDENGVLTYVNEVSFKLFGYSEKDFDQKMNALQMIDTKDRVIAATNIQLVLQDAEPSTHEYTALRKDGTNFPVLIYSSAIVNDGKVLGLRGAIIDITERKLVEEKLLKSEHRLRESQRIAHIGGWFWDMIGPIIWADETYRIYGVSPETYTPTTESYINIIHPGDRLAMQHWIADCANGKKPDDLEFRTILPDGSIRILNGRGELIYNDKNKPILMSGTVQDITDRKLAENALSESEKKYRLLFTENPQPMWIYDLESLAFLEVNQAAIKHYGYSRQEFLSMTLKDIRPAEDIPALLKDIEQTTSNLNSAGEWRHIKKNGEIIVVEIISHSLISNNRHARHVLINDITERKRSQLEYQTMIQTSRDGF